jgi:hypothetical protein
MNISEENNHIYNHLYGYLAKNNLLEEFKPIFNVENNKRGLATLWSNIWNFVNKYNFNEYKGIGYSIQENRDKIKSDIGELFCLAWMLVYGGEIGFYHIKPTERDAMGTDFIGFNGEGLNSILQAKTYNKTTELELDKLRTFFQSAPRHQVQFSKNEKIKSWFLFMPYGKIKGEWNLVKDCKIIDYKIINKITEKAFWKSLYITICKEF